MCIGYNGCGTVIKLDERVDYSRLWNLFYILVNYDEVVLLDCV